MADDIPNFTADDELEALLSEPVSELDEDTRIDVQCYKSRKLKAIRDAGMSGDRPGWWASDGVAPERADVAPGASGGEVRPSSSDTPGASPDGEASDDTDGASEDGTDDDTEESVTEEPVEESGDDDGEEAEEDEEVETLPREALGEEPSEDELIRARLIEQPVEQDDSEGIFFTTIDRRKIYLAYGANAHYLTLYYYQVPTTVADPQLIRWVKDLLARRAFDYALDEGLTVIPQRAAVSENFLDRHSEYRDHVKRPDRRRPTSAA